MARAKEARTTLEASEVDREATVPEKVIHALQALPDPGGVGILGGGRASLSAFKALANEDLVRRLANNPANNEVRILAPDVYHQLRQYMGDLKARAFTLVRPVHHEIAAELKAADVNPEAARTMVYNARDIDPGVINHEALHALLPDAYPSLPASRKVMRALPKAEVDPSTINTYHRMMPGHGFLNNEQIGNALYPGFHEGAFRHLALEQIARRLAQRSGFSYATSPMGLVFRTLPK